jgi:hypothetical protein
MAVVLLQMNGLLGRFPFHQIRPPPSSNVRKKRYAIRESGIAEKKFRAKKGQALIWLSNFLHGGSRQTDKAKTRWSQVTHYFFEDCAYYTPMHSDPFYGSIAFRRMADVRTGAVVENRYLGAEIPKRFRKYVEPPKKPATPPDLREPAQAAAAYGQRLPRRRGWRERIASLLS